MKPVLAALLFVGAWLMARWWFADPARPIAVVRSGAASSVGPMDAADAAAASVARPALSRPPPPSAPVLSVRADDDVLETMMTGHRDAMLMLREAAYYALQDRLAACRAYITGHAVCWLKFRCALRGQLMALQFATVECEPAANDSRLSFCVRDQALLPDPIGVPPEAARDLGNYEGPLEMAWYVN